MAEHPYYYCDSCGRRFNINKRGTQFKLGRMIYYVCSQQCCDNIMARHRAENSGSGCFITTAVCKTLQKADDCEELTMFRQFRDTYMQETSEMQAEVEEYYEIAPQICAKIEANGEEMSSIKYTLLWQTQLKPAFEALKHGDKQAAHDIYKGMVLGLKKEFIGEGEK